MTIRRMNVQTGEVEIIDEVAPSFPPTAEEAQAKIEKQGRRNAARAKLEQTTGMTIEEIKEALEGTE